MDDLTVEQAIEQKRLRAQAVLLWRPGATAAQWEQAAKEASGDVLDLLAVVDAALSHEHTESAERVVTLPVEGCELCAAFARLAAPAVREIPPVPATTVYVEGPPRGFR